MEAIVELEQGIFLIKNPTNLVAKPSLTLPM